MRIDALVGGKAGDLGAFVAPRAQRQQRVGKDVLLGGKVGIDVHPAVGTVNKLVMARQFHGGDVRQPPARAQPFFLVQHTAQKIRRVEHTLHEYPGFPAAHRAHGFPQRRRGIGGMAEFDPAFNARLSDQRTHHRLVAV